MKEPYTLLWLIPFLPLAGACIIGALALGGARDRSGPSRGLVAVLAVLLPAISCALTVLASVRLDQLHRHLGKTALFQELWEWFAIRGESWSLSVGFGLLFDRLSSTMLLIITGIGTLIVLYAVGYMWRDRGFARFMAYMNLFLAAMSLLVLGDNLAVTFLGWEGVGLCSYLLIGFWHQQGENNDAARKAFIFNRVGDLGFLLGAFALLTLMSGQGQGSLDYREIAAWFRSPTNLDYLTVNGGLLGVACLLLFLGCTAKSAQIPLAAWLPDAMAGPTPVSALIHAATMVTAGVFLLARLSDVFVHAPPCVLQTVLTVGLLTAAWGAVAGLVQTDIKRVLAYSTVSQLGFMFMACGVGAFDLALFLLFTHAFFKATLFLGAGAVIQGLGHEQDLRRMGALDRLMPYTYTGMCLGWYAIIGLPGGAGFWSKDLLLERLFLGSGVEPVIGGLALAIALVTALYMSRLMYLVFWSPARHGDEAKPAIREGSFTMMLPLMVLGLGSLVVGMLWAPLLDPLFAPSGSAVVTMGGTVKTVDIGGGSVLTVFRDYLAPVVGEAQRHFLAQTDPDLLKAARHGPGVLLPLLGVLAAIAGILVARAFWRRGWPGRRDGSLEGFAASWSWCFDRVAHALVVLPLTWSAWVLAWVVDAAIGFMVHGLTDLVRFISDGYTSVQRPRLRSSLTLSLAGGAVLLAVLLLSWPFNLVVAVVAGLAVALILLLELLCR